jgi:molybdopterin-synthase adenylyltransferase
LSLLSSKEKTRYSRNIFLNGIGLKGQETLKQSKVTIVGAGGLGSPIALYLASAGVGSIRLIDYDKVDLTNLQRQILFETDSIGKNKTDEAKYRLERLNSEIKIDVITERLGIDNISNLFIGSDLVLEGSDNFYTKFLVNDSCVLMGIPLIIGGVLRFEGQIIGVTKSTSCYRCTFEELPENENIPNCAEAGVLGSVPGVIGSLMATEALKYLLFKDTEIFGKILLVDLLNLDFRKIKRKRNTNCKCCGEIKFQNLEHLRGKDIYYC